MHGAPGCRAHAIGGQVGDAPVREGQPRLGAIFVFTEDRDAERLDLLQRRLYQVKHEVDVVDHHVEYDADVRRSKRVRTEPFAVDVFRIADERAGHLEGGVKTLDVSDLQGRSAAIGGGHDFGRLRHRRSQRLFDHRRDSSPEKFERDRVVARSRNGDRDGIDAIEQLAVIVEPPGPARVGDGAAPFGTGVGDSHQLGRRKLRIDAGVMPPQRTGPHDAHPKPAHAALRL